MQRIFSKNFENDRGCSTYDRGSQLVRFSTSANNTDLSFTGVEAAGALSRDVITIGDRSPKPCTDNDVLIKNYQTSPSLFFWTLSNYIAGRIQMKILS